MYPLILDKDISAEIGAQIRYARTKAGMTRADLAESLSIRQSAVANWEAGIRVPRIQTLYRIAYSLNCSIYDLMPEEDPR